MTGNEVILSGYFSSVGVYNRTVSCAMQEKADAILDFLAIGYLKEPHHDGNVDRRGTPAPYRQGTR